MLRPLQADLKENIHQATLHFHASLPGSPGEAYLASRGIGPGTARAMGLGYVDPDSPLEGWERHAGRISLPYLNMVKDPCWLKFRAVPSVLGYDVPKMTQEAGGGVRLYNTISMSAPGGILVLAEGEMDVVTLTALGLTAVGIPGASTWKKHFHRALQGWDRVVLFYDEDDAGRSLVKAVKADMPDVIPMSAPGGHNDIGAAYEAGLGDRIIALAHGRQEVVTPTITTTPTITEVDSEPEEADTTTAGPGPEGPGGTGEPEQLDDGTEDTDGDGSVDPGAPAPEGNPDQQDSAADEDYDYDPRDEFGF